MRIAVGADHKGFELKEYIKRNPILDTHEVTDYSAHSYDGGDDYTKYAFLVAEAVSRGDADVGLLFCNTGTGMAMAASKVDGILAACCINEDQVKEARSHNGAVILTMGRKYVPNKRGVNMVKTLLNTKVEDGSDNRHKRRREQIRGYGSDI